MSEGYGWIGDTAVVSVCVNYTAIRFASNRRVAHDAMMGRVGVRAVSRVQRGPSGEPVDPAVRGTGDAGRDGPSTSPELGPAETYSRNRSRRYRNRGARARRTDV